MAANDNVNKEIQVKGSETMEDGYVILPYNADQFKGFIKSLLGSPQTINKEFRSPFEIEADGINQLYQLIIQRVTQQNEGLLARFHSKITFSDNSSVEINSIQELITYNEVKPVYVTGLHLIWDFVVKFNDKDYPEKQTISISFYTEPYNTGENGEYTMVSRRGETIGFRIEHTARTWAADIESLLNNYIENIKKHPNKIQKMIYMKSETIGNIIAVLLFLMLVLGAIKSVKTYNNNLLSDYNSLSGLEQKVNFITEDVLMQISVNVFYVIVYLLVGFVCVVIIGNHIDKSAKYGEYSYILLNKGSYKNKEEKNKNNNREMIKSILRVIGSVILGVVSSIFFEWLFK